MGATIDIAIKRIAIRIHPVEACVRVSMGQEKWRLTVAGSAVNSVVKFPNGCLKQKLAVEVHEQRTRRVIVSRSSTLQYVGGNYGAGYVTTNALLQHLLAVEDGGRVQLYPAELIVLAPYFRPEPTKERQTADTNRAQMDALAAAFGSTRRRRAVESRQRLRVDESNLQLSARATVAEIQESALSESVDESAALDTIPPQNRDATIPQEVYRVEDLFSAEEHPYLDQLAEPLLAADHERLAQWRADAAYPEYVLQRVQRLSADPRNRLLEARLLVYYHLLVQVSRLRYSDLKRKDPLPNVEQPTKRKLLDTFTLVGKGERGTVTRTFPYRLKDKVLAYLLVVALVLEDYKLDLAAVQPDGKASLQRLVTVGQALGCRVGSCRGSRGKYLELGLPLQEPPRPKKARRSL